MHMLRNLELGSCPISTVGMLLKNAFDSADHFLEMRMHGFLFIVDRIFLLNLSYQLSTS